LLSIIEDAKNLTWHANGRKCDNFFQHVVDSSKWKRFDEIFPEFGAKARNLRFGLL